MQRKEMHIIPKKTPSCVINGQQNIPLFVITPGYITHSNL